MAKTTARTAALSLTMLLLLCGTAITQSAQLQGVIEDVAAPP